MAKGGGSLPGTKWIQTATEMTILGLNQPLILTSCRKQTVLAIKKGQRASMWPNNFSKHRRLHLPRRRYPFYLGYLLPGHLTLSLLPHFLTKIMMRASGNSSMPNIWVTPGPTRGWLHSLHRGGSGWSSTDFETRQGCWTWWHWTRTLSLWRLNIGSASHTSLQCHWLVQHLTHLFNAIDLSGHFPPVFQQGHVIPISKNSNYKGVIILSNIRKVLEKLILLRIHLQDSPPSMNPLQGGFRQGYGCTNTAHVLQEAIQSLWERSKKAYVAFLDVRKAFDTVWQAGLFVKVHQKVIKGHLWRLINNWYRTASSTPLGPTNI